MISFFSISFSNISKTKSQLEDAERELFAEDDSIPVKNEDAREHISKLIGVGLDVKLIQLDSRIGKITNHGLPYPRMILLPLMRS